MKVLEKELIAKREFLITERSNIDQFKIERSDLKSMLINANIELREYLKEQPITIEKSHAIQPYPELEIAKAVANASLYMVRKLNHIVPDNVRDLMTIKKNDTFCSVPEPRFLSIAIPMTVDGDLVEGCVGDYIIDIGITASEQVSNTLVNKNTNELSKIDDMLELVKTKTLFEITELAARPEW